MSENNMQSTNITKCLALSVLCCGLIWQPAQADEERRMRGRSGLNDLSHEMSTCAAYFSLLSSIVQNSAGPETKTTAAERMKSTGQAILSRAINIAKYIGMDENAPVERAQVWLKEMVETINSDPPNSLKTMHTKYGQPCDALLTNAPQRFLDLLQDYADER